MPLSLTPRSSKRNAHVAFVICALFLASICFAQKPKVKEIRASSDHPLWRIDLQSQGYPANRGDLQRRRNFANFDTISFVSDGVLAATFVTREDIPDLQRREDPNHLRPYRLHAIFLDALTGKVLHTLDWPIENPSAGIFPRADSGFLLLTTDRIVSYSAGWTQLRELSLSDLHPSTADLGGIAESPSYKSLVVQFIDGNSALCLNIRTDTLDFSPIPCGVLDVFTASDNGIVAPEKLPGGKELHETGPTGAFIQYGVAMPDAPPETTVRVLNPDQARAAHTICSPCVGIPQFINDEMLALYSPTYISIVDRAGKVSFTQDYSPTVEWIDELGRPVRSSANGMRLAIASNKSRFAMNNPFTDGNVNGAQPEPGASREQQNTAYLNAQSRAANIIAAVHMSTGDIPAEFPLDVQVFDLSAAQWIYTLQIESDHLHKIWGLALSPSGNQLAIDSGGTIQVFALPPSSVIHK
jgi:hypothetical protein